MQQRGWSTRAAGACLVAAAVLFWLSWLLMPGVGVTDSEEILAKVASARPAVACSAVLQIVSAVLYVPALIGIALFAEAAAARAVRWAAALLLVGAMGSAADAVFHLLAYAMTQPGMETRALVPVMQFMQGPGLRLIAPLLLAFFVGGAWLSVALAQKGIVSGGSAWLQAVALAGAVAGALLVSRGAVSQRVVGLTVLAAVSGAQAWVGLALARAPADGSGS